MTARRKSFSILLLLVAVASAQQTCSRPSPCNSGDYNPELNNGQRGNPGIKAKINQRAFQYLSDIAADLIAAEIPKTRLDPITQNVPEFNGYITSYNMYISRFRRPARVAIYPSEPNHINIAVQNFDLGITGNLAGQLVVLIPLQLSGIVDILAQGISITMVTGLEADCNGRPSVRVLGCSAHIDYLNVNIINGGLIGNIINTQFKSQVVGMLSPVMTKLLCQKAAAFVTNDLNSKLSGIPTQISIGQVLGQLLPKSSSNCNKQKRQRAGKLLQRTGRVAARGTLLRQTKHVIRNRPSIERIAAVKNIGNTKLRSAASYPSDHPVGTKSLVEDTDTDTETDTETDTDVIDSSSSKNVQSKGPAKVPPGAETAIDPNAGGPNDPTFKADTSCNNPTDSLAALSSLFDIHRLDNFYLNLGLVRQPHASSCCLAIDLFGEVAPSGACTPFGPAPMQFPCCGTKMVEGLISDHVINSFLYHAHRQGIFRATLDNNTPKIGKFLKTTCPSEAPEDDSDDSSGGGLGGLNLCIGDIVPALREKYPGKFVQLQLSTERAPSVILRRATGAHIDLLALVDVVAMANPPAKVGTLGIEAVADIAVSFANGRVAGKATFEKLKLTDKSGTLGLPQLALDNISQLGKGLVEKLVNDQLKNGLPLSLPASLPIKVCNPMIDIYDRYLYVQSDFTIDPSLFTLGSGGCVASCSRPCR